MANDNPPTENDALLGNVSTRLSDIEAIETAVEATQVEEARVEEEPTTVVGSILEVITEGVEGFVEGAQNVAEGAQNVAEGFAENIVEGAQNVVEGAQHVAENIAEGAQNVVDQVEEMGIELRDNAVTEFHEVTDTMLDEMHEADDGESFFMEMALARNLSILPTDIVQVAHTDLQSVAEAPHVTDHTDGGDDDDDESPKKHEPTLGEELAAAGHRIPLQAYIVLATAVIALSSIGPLLDLQQGCTPTMKIYWRMSATAMLLFPFAVVAVKHDGLPQLSLSQWSTFFLAAASYATMCVGFVQALRYTSVGNAVILSNSQAIMLLIAKFFVGARISLMESSGALAAFAGAVLCSVESSGRSTTSEHADDTDLTWLGDICALTSGLGGVFYLVFAKTTRSVMGLYPFMFLVMGVGSSFVLTFLTFVLREDISLSRDTNHGIWGWMNFTADRLPLEVMMVVVCNMCGSLGYVRAMQYFDTIVISVAGLMEPVIAEFTAYLLGVGFLPGLMGWIGNLLVAGGTFAVVSSPASSHDDAKTKGGH